MKFYVVLFTLLMLNGHGVSLDLKEEKPAIKKQISKDSSREILETLEDGRDKISPQNHEMEKGDVINEFWKITQSCLNSVDEAGSELNSIIEHSGLDANSWDEFKGSYDNYTDDEHLSPFDLIDDFPSFNLNEFHYAASENLVHKNDLENILTTINNACKDLPKAVSNGSVRRSKRSFNFESKIQEITTSLKSWADRWLNSLEQKVDVFLVNCMQDPKCEEMLEKFTKICIEGLLAQGDSMNKASLDILKEMLNELKQMKNREDGVISNYQINDIKLRHNYLEGFLEEEKQAYNLAEGIVNSDVNQFDGSTLTNEENKAEIELEERFIVTKVPETFLSVALGSGLIQHKWGHLQEKSSKFLRAASALSPSMIRVGGSAANFLTFEASNYHKSSDRKAHPKHKNSVQDDNVSFRAKSKRSSKGFSSTQLFKMTNLGGFDFLQNDCEPQREDGSYQKNFTNFTMTESDWRFLIRVSKRLGWKLVFNLNQFWRNSSTGQWDPSNARLLFRNEETKDAQIIWHLGNEPNAYQHKFGVSITPEQAADDLKTLKKELTDVFGPNTPGSVRIVGPDVTRPRHLDDEKTNLTEDSMEYLEKFLEFGGKNYIDVVTFHQYYVNGRTASVENFMSHELLNVFPKQLRSIVEIRDREVPEKPIWITETATAWGGGASNISNRFAGCFPWLDKLGAAALGGAEVVFRQTIYGGCYALLDPFVYPYPDFWVSVLHKKLVGQKVLLIRSRLVPHTIRVYGHCLNKDQKGFKEGAVVIFGMNLGSKEEFLKVTNENLRNASKYLFKLTAPKNDLKSRGVELNGKTLKLNKEGDVPEMTGIRDENQNLKLSPFSINFWVIYNANISICQ